MARRRASSPQTLHRLVERAIRRNGLLATGESVVVAVSGGADSIFLLHALHNLATRLRLRLHVAHFDHGWRGAASAADASFVGDVAARLGLPFHLGAIGERRTLAVDKSSTSRRRAPEDAARRARYAFLRDVCRDTGATVVATGHTLDDQVETILLALLRGSGPRALGGMPPSAPLPTPAADGVRLVRPLLDLERAALRAALDALGQEWREDASNQDERYPRNRLRASVIPALEAISPGFRSALLRAGDLSAQAGDFLHHSAQEAARSLFRRLAPGEQAAVAGDAAAGEPGVLGSADGGVPAPLAIERRAFLALHTALQAEVLRIAVARAQGSAQDLEWAHITGAIATIRRGRGGAVAWLAPGLCARLARGWIVIEGAASETENSYAGIRVPDDPLPR